MTFSEVPNERHDAREFSDKRGDLNVCSIGPFDRFPVVVNGWTVDLLEAQWDSDGSVYVSMPGHSISLNADDAARIIHFIADAIAIASGWTSHPESPDWTPTNDIGPVPRPPFHRMFGIGPSQAQGEGRSE